MSAGLPTFFAPAKKKLLQGKFNLATDAIYCALLTSSQALSAGFLGASGDARYADLTAEVANGNGYTTGGQALTGDGLSYYVASASIVAGGTGGTTGTQTVTGTTGAGTLFQASVNIVGGAITTINSISNAGLYTTLPTNPAAEPVTGAGLTGASMLLTMGLDFVCGNPTWNSSTITAKYAAFYDNTSANKDLLCFVDLETTVGTGVSTTNGTLQVQVPTNGLFGLA